MDKSQKKLLSKKLPQQDRMVIIYIYCFKSKTLLYINIYMYIYMSCNIIKAILNEKHRLY